ncbi:regulatory protein GemA [Ottowia sp.]|uniref:regulatory protein GemA n=1 Tax=Ottowia sp. TaxID=1898956 RepID=UPI0025CE685B|nr:regulatory protein GemA [Ottowia sp.]
MIAANRRAFTAHNNADAVAAQRQRELGHIHQGKATLGWSDDDYRYHLRNLTGKTSASELDAGARRKVLDHMATLGYTPKASTFKPFDQAAKIKWLWRKVGEAGGLREATPAALLAFVGRTTGKGVSDVKFLPVADASKVIEALKAMLDRAKRAQGGAA